MKRNSYLFLIILLLGLFLRFYELEEVLSLHRDEAFLGYNAYSILKTGKDISDKFLPLHLESFIYSPAGYSYFSIPFIYMFGLSEFSVRAASAFFGALTIIVVYFLVKELFLVNRASLSKTSFWQAPQRRDASRISIHYEGSGEILESQAKPDRQNDEIPAFIASLLLAISPWHVNLSRTATENVIVIFFLSLGILFFLKYLRKSYKYLALSFLCFGATFLLYQAPRAFLPIFIPFLIFAFTDRKKIIKDKIMLGFLYVSVIILPLAYILFSPDLSLRIRSLSIFENSYTKQILTEQIANDGKYGLPYLATRIFHNKIVGNFLVFSENYFKHFSFDFLFLDKGLPDRYRVPMIGLLYVFQLPLILLGLFYVLQKSKRIGIFLLGWILIAPIGSALTFDDVPNLQRTLIGLPAYSFLSSYGLTSLLGFIRSINTVFFKAATLGTLFVVVYSLSYYLVQYYIQAVNYNTWYRQDGYKELVHTVNKLLPKYKKAVITNRESAPTIFFLFFSKYDPSLFQRDTYLSSHRSFDRMNFGKYEFTEDECPLRNIKDGNTIKSSGAKNVLYVNSALCKEIPGNSKILAEIRRKGGEYVFYIVAYFLTNY